MPFWPPHAALVILVCNARASVLLPFSPLLTPSLPLWQQSPSQVPKPPPHLPTIPQTSGMEGQSSVQPEAAIWCALCWIVICARFVSRRIALGAWKLLRLEDMLAVLAGGTGTTLMVLLTKIEIGFRATESEAGITEEQIEIRTTTLKLLVAAEQLQIITVWLMKAAMLLMYYRLT